MPLIQNDSHEAFVENIRKLVDEGYPVRQATAIAYDIQRRNDKK